jgi:uncharacterized protein (TIGR03083 family)
MTRVGSDDYWQLVASQRRAIADRLDALPAESWDSPSWCAGWRVRDVLGHLVYLAEASTRSVSRDILRNGMRPDPALSKLATELGALPVPQLTVRLRAAAGGRFHIPVMPRDVVLGELAVHGADMFGFDAPAAALDPAELVPVLDAYRRFSRLAFHTTLARGRRLVATDADWSAGRGPELRGSANVLVLVLANRRQAMERVSGSDGG